VNPAETARQATEAEYALMMAAACKQAEAMRDAAVAAATRCAAYRVSYGAELLGSARDAAAQLKALVPPKPPAPAAN
jgi:hypothetical protein